MKINFEDYLIERHAEQYVGVDDDMPDDFDSWLERLDQSELITYADLWAISLVRKQVQEDHKLTLRIVAEAFEEKK